MIEVIEVIEEVFSGLVHRHVLNDDQVDLESTCGSGSVLGCDGGRVEVAMPLAPRRRPQCLQTAVRAHWPAHLSATRFHDPELASTWHRCSRPTI